MSTKNQEEQDVLPQYVEVTLLRDTYRAAVRPMTLKYYMALQSRIQRLPPEQRRNGAIAAGKEYIVGCEKNGMPVDFEEMDFRASSVLVGLAQDWGVVADTVGNFGDPTGDDDDDGEEAVG